MSEEGNSAGYNEKLTTTPSPARRDFPANDDKTSIAVLRTATSIAVILLLAYFGSELWSRRENVLGDGIFHWLSIVAASCFLVATFVPAFRAYWKLPTLVFAVVLISIWIAISDARSMAVMFAAMGLAETAAFFVGDYRRGVDAQIGQLKQVAAIRESQIAGLAHDIRSPVAALAGFAQLLEDDDLDDDDRRAILERIGTSAWLADLTVSNLLDLYQISSGHLSASPAQVDPNRIVGNAASNCALQAIHKGLTLTINYGDVPQGNFDPRHLERIARNLLAYSIARSSAGEVRLRTSPCDSGITIEVEDDGPPPTDEEVATLLNSSLANGLHPAKTMVGLLVARSLAETSGGRVMLTLPDGERVRLTAEVPSAKIASKPSVT